MPKISQAKRDARRQDILDAALRCFSDRGFHATTTGDIAREAGVSQGSIYLYFETKDDIIVALAHERRAGEAMITAMAEKEQDPVRGLSAFITAFGDLLSASSPMPERRVAVQGFGEALVNPRIHHSMVEELGAVRANLSRLIARARNTGQVRPEVDPDALAQILVSLFQGLVVQIALGQPLDRPAIGRTVFNMIAETALTPAGKASFTLGVHA